MGRMFVDQILSQQPTVPLYHYTRQTGLLGIVRSREMWTTHTQYLNDSREFLYAVEMVREELTRMSSEADRAAGEAIPETSHEWGDTLLNPVVYREARKKAFEEVWESFKRAERGTMVNVCVASFSEVGDSLSQWRAYAPRAGFSLGFHGDRLASLAEGHGFRLAKCIYDRGTQLAVVRDLINDMLNAIILRERREGDPSPTSTDAPSLGKGILKLAPILKDPSFSDEKEWRIITTPQPSSGPHYDFREGSSGLIPFFRFPLESADVRIPLAVVIVGPTPDPRCAAASVQSLLINQGFDLASVQVRASTVPYRTW